MGKFRKKGINKYYDVDDRARRLALGIVLTLHNGSGIEEYDKTIRSLVTNGDHGDFPEGIVPYRVYDGLTCKEIADEIEGIRAAIKLEFMGEDSWW